MKFLEKEEIITIIKNLSYYDVVKNTAANDSFGIPTIAQINLETGNLEFIHENEPNGLLLFRIEADEGMEDLESLSPDELKALELENVTVEDICAAYADDMTVYSNDFDWDEINNNLEKIYNI